MPCVDSCHQNWKPLICKPFLSFLTLFYSNSFFSFLNIKISQLSKPLFPLNKYTQPWRQIQLLNLVFYSVSLHCGWFVSKQRIWTLKLWVYDRNMRFVMSWSQIVYPLILGFVALNWVQVFQSNAQLIPQDEGTL